MKYDRNKLPNYAKKMGLILRNLFVIIASVFFLISIFADHQHTWLKAVGYIFGMLAYISEYLHLTKFFHVKIPHDEAFMIYCFAPLYLLMGISYLLH